MNMARQQREDRDDGGQHMGDAMRRVSEHKSRRDKAYEEKRRLHMMRRQQGQQASSGPTDAVAGAPPGDEWEAAKVQARARQRVAPGQGQAEPRAMAVQEARAQEFRAPPGAMSPRGRDQVGDDRRRAQEAKARYAEQLKQQMEEPKTTLRRPPAAASDAPTDPGLDDRRRAQEAKMRYAEQLKQQMSEAKTTLRQPPPQEHSPQSPPKPSMMQQQARNEQRRKEEYADALRRQMEGDKRKKEAERERRRSPSPPRFPDHPGVNRKMSKREYAEELR